MSWKFIKKLLNLIQRILSIFMALEMKKAKECIHTVNAVLLKVRHINCISPGHDPHGYNLGNYQRHNLGAIN